MDTQPNNHLNLLNFRVVDMLLSADLSHIDKVLSLVTFICCNVPFKLHRATVWDTESTTMVGQFVT